MIVLKIIGGLLGLWIVLALVMSFSEWVADLWYNQNRGTPEEKRFAKRALGVMSIVALFVILGGGAYLTSHYGNPSTHETHETSFDQYHEDIVPTEP